MTPAAVGGAPSRVSSSPWADRLAAGAAVLAVVASAAGRGLMAFTRGLDPDELEHLHGGWCLAHGLWPYRDYFEHHTPWLHLALVPLLRAADVDHDPKAAVATVLAGRAAMWLVATLAIALTFRLARLWQGAATGWLAAALIGSTVAFVQKTAEVRPDGPAVACLLASWIALLGALRRGPGTRRARWRHAAAGVGLGAAVMLTQKALFTLPATALVLAWWVLDRRSAGSRPRRALDVAWFTAGVLVPMLATIALFAPHTGIRAFVDANLVVNATWRHRFSPAPLLARMAAQNAVVFTLAAVGLARAAGRLGQATAVPGGDALIVLQTAGLAAGALVVPSPYLQYYAMVLPLTAVLAASAIRDIAAAVRAIVRASPRAEAASAGAAVLGLGLAVVHPGAILADDARRVRPKLEDQLGRIRMVLATTSPRDTVMDGFTGAGVFRPHAYYYFFLHDEIRARLGAPEIGRLQGDLRDGRIAPAVVLYDDDLRALPAEITSFLEENYAPAGDPVVWRAKDLYLDGPATGGRLKVGRAPTDVLVGRGWGPGEETEGRWVRRMQGSRSTLRLPLRRPADLVVTVHARAEPAGGGGALALAINDVPVGAEPLRPGWNDYPFPVPAAAWRAGVNAARLTRDAAGEVTIEGVTVGAR